jgi:gamma-glutamyltranspeptidase / glutathione hydrolase
MRDVLRDRQQWANSAMVSTGSAAATLAALDVLAEGGNAFDAAITASAVLTVALPMAGGPAGDVAAVLHVAGSPHALALTGLGCAPSGATPDAIAARGRPTVPVTGMASACTPGMIDAWFALHRAYGSIPLARLLAPAVQAAGDGLPVTAQVARWTADNLSVLTQPEFAELFAPVASPSAVGSRLRIPGLAALYAAISAPGVRATDIRTLISDRIAALSRDLGGFFEPEDCLPDRSEIGPALTATVGNRQVAVTGAPTQGVLLLQNLALCARRRIGEIKSPAARIHLQSEIFHQTFAWRLRNLADPRSRQLADPLDDELLDQLDSAIDPVRRSATTYAGHYSDGDTQHFAIIDREGNAVSWTQSLGLGFGSGVGLPDLGLLLSNRLGRSATIDPRQPNCCAPGRRPVNTILAWSTSAEHGVDLLGGTPGGDGQCQWNTQVLSALLLEGADPLDALNRPRWTYLPGADKVEARLPQQLQVDDTTPAAAVDDLRGLGYKVRERAGVGGAIRLVGRSGASVYGLDDGRQEGLTAGH